MSYCERCGGFLPEGALFCPACGVEVGAVSAKMAFWGERFVAWLIDSIIIGLVAYSLSLFALNINVPFSFLPRWIKTGFLSSTLTYTGFFCFFTGH